MGSAVDSFTGDIFDFDGSKQTDKAIRAQQRSTDQANATQKYIFDMQREDAAPWRRAGELALPQLQNADFQRDFTMDDFQTDPGYEFRMAEGMKALERSAAARGGLNSTRTMKELTRYGQDFASNEYTNAYNRFNADRDRRFNRLSSLAGLGQTAQSQVNQAGMNYGNNVSANQIGMGNAIASANIAQANRSAGMFNSALGMGGMWLGGGA